MSDEWVETTLGEVMSLNPEGLQGFEEGDVFRYVDIASVNESEGVRTATLTECTTADAPGRAKRRIRTGDVLVSTVRPNLRAFALVVRELDGEVASTGFCVLRSSNRILPGFAWCVIRELQFCEAMVALCTGSNYPAIRPADVAGFRFSLPPLSVQARIVNLLEHLDTLIANLERERSAAATTLARSTFEILMDRSSGDEVVISSLLDRNIGGLWGDGLGTDDLDVAVFRSTEFTNDGYLSGPAEAMRSVSERQYESRSLAAGDILVEKSGGTVGRPVGRVVWVSEVDVAQSAIGANFLQLIRPNTESVAGRYLFWLLWSHHKHGVAEQYQRATTSIRNLRTKEYLGRPVFLPSREEQEVIATALDSIQKLILSLDVELASMKDLRSATLTALLSREIEIPETYDELLGAAP